ncbi:kinase-like protein [Rostrohypoxylon terebratum]|nr:kinase-like protein [Rostrohypoxylon terebratum]
MATSSPTFFTRMRVEMFLALKQGNIHSLLRGDRPLDIDVRKDFEFVSKCLKQMLQALDYLASENIVHRDIKPANVLYVMDSDNNPDFQLADFGLAHDFSSGESVDRWFVGTKGYMAPELEHAEQIGIDQGDVYKMDVWSLFMTVVWIVDAEQFRNMSRYPLDLGDWVDIGIKAAQSTLRPLRMMAKRLPRERASAAQMLIHLYDGDGLSTPRDQVAPLDFS